MSKLILALNGRSPDAELIQIFGSRFVVASLLVEELRFK